jgi:hypothetical protein
MATRLNSAPWDNSLDANFRAWAKFIADALLAFGWTRAADTGQIDWATVARPTAANTPQGFEVWRSGDALTQMFLKVEYGSGSNALHPGLWLTLGTGSNGSGTITGNVSTRQQLTAGGNTTGNVSLRFSGDASRFSALMASDFNNAQNSIAFCVERSYNIVSSPTPALSDTDDYTVLGWVTSATKQAQVIPKVGTGSVPAARNFGMLVGDDGITVRGVSPAYCSLYPFWGRPCNPLRGLAAYMNVEMTGQDDDTGDWYGVAINFFRAGGTLNNIALSGTPATSSRLAMRWD